MAEERIDIEVTDKVDANAAKKINQIADAAERGETYVNRLKTALANVNTSSIDKLVSAMARADTAQARLLNAQVRLSNAQDQGALAAAKLATQNQKLATESARTEAAQARAAAAASAAESASLRLAAAQQRVTGASQAASTAEERLAADTAALRARFDAGEISIRGFVQELQKLNGAASAASAATDKIGQSVDRASNAARRYQGVARGTSHVNANIIAQLQDIGVSLAGGQNPLLVMIQQGSQLHYIASTMDGGFKALTATILRLLAPFALLGAVAAGLYLSFKNFTNEMASRHKPELEAYARSLGLTEKEMRKLKNETVGANGKLKEMDVLTITVADSWNGFWMTVKEGLSSMSQQWDAVVNFIKPLWDACMNFLNMAFIGFYGLVVGGMRGIVKTIINLPTVASETAKSIANVTLAAIEWMANKTIDAINWVAEKANTITSVVGYQFGKLDHVSLGGLERQGMNLADVFATEVTDAVREADRTITAFGQRWEANSVEAARRRIQGLAEAIQNNRNPGRTPRERREPKTQADYINETNNALDNELARMKMLKDEREVQQRLDQIEQDFLRRRMRLDAAQLAIFRKKIQAIQDYKYVQQEMDRILEAAEGPQRTYNAALQAATDLLARGRITQEQFNQEQVKASRILAQATDPLFQMKEAMDSAEAAVRTFGQAAEQAAYYEQIRQAMLQHGIVLSPQYVAGVNAEVDALMRRNAELQKGQFIQSQLNSVIQPALEQQMFLDNYRTMYDQLEQLRQSDLDNERVYQQAMYALQAKYNEMRLQGYSDLFGALASVASKGHGVIGAIGKAAAVAQATIDGYVAVQKALASLPPPFNYAAAAAVAIKTGANVAGILSTNAGSFATGGQFMVEGKGGIDSNNINMNVTRGERVTIETPKQQRENDAANGPAEVSVPVKIINNIDPRIAIDAIDTAEGEQVIMNTISRNAPAIQRLLGSG
jgi:hypothetical protein